MFLSGLGDFNLEMDDQAENAIQLLGCTVTDSLPDRLVASGAINLACVSCSDQT